MSVEEVDIEPTPTKFETFRAFLVRKHFVFGQPAKDFEVGQRSNKDVACHNQALHKVLELFLEPHSWSSGFY